jgi:hypothetical protein
MGRPPEKEAEPAKKGLPEICKKTVPFHGVLPVVNFYHHVKGNLRCAFAFTLPQRWVTPAP